MADIAKRRVRDWPALDTHIEALLTVKLVLRLSLRAVEGFATGMARLVGAA